MIKKGKVNFLIDLGFGSCGKGNVAAYIAENVKDLDLAITNNSANAGHIHWDKSTQKFETLKMLPTAGVVNKSANCIIGSGAVISKDRLLEEIQKYGVSSRLNISAYAPVITQDCIDYEAEHLKHNASTGQGVGAAIGLQAMRSPKIKIVKDYPEFENWCHHHISDIILNRVGKHRYTALAEICQGYGLSLHSEFYPKCTSRDVNVGQALAYLDIPHTLVGDVIGVARTYLIRVGNVEGNSGSEGHGSSGPTLFDSQETTWEDLSDKLGYKVEEFTTVTKRRRRIFTFSKNLFESAIKRNGVNIVFITFWDYLLEDERKSMLEYLYKIAHEFNLKAVYIVSGPGDKPDHFQRVIQAQ